MGLRRRTPQQRLQPSSPPVYTSEFVRTVYPSWEVESVGSGIEMKCGTNRISSPSFSAFASDSSSRIEVFDGPDEAGQVLDAWVGSLQAVDRHHPVTCNVAAGSTDPVLELLHPSGALFVDERWEFLFKVARADGVTADTSTFAYLVRQRGSALIWEITLAPGSTSELGC
jgi:hypothetical protein